MFRQTMKFLILLGLVATALSVPVLESVEEEVLKYYDPAEEDPFRIRYIYQEDEDGNLKLIDLFEEEPNVPRANINDLTFYLFTPSNPTQAQVIPGNDFNALSNSNFNASLDNLFISHGWKSNAGGEVTISIRSAILEKSAFNVFGIDWSRPANQLYITAKNAVPVIGHLVGDFINQMMSTFNIGSDRFNLVGHSLGAHLVGCAGARVNGYVKTIVGLDPAGPLFTVGNIDNRIDPTDGAFVQIIHTNGRLLGFDTSCGHADYRPNGGRCQPGCGIDIAGACAHSRSYKYYAESIRSGGFSSRKCGSMNDYNNGKCNNNQISFMGQFPVDRLAKGDYFLATTDSPPFALG